jgi:hypothetical protein
MENNRAGIAALIFILLIVGVNGFMYALVRGIMRGGKNGPFETMMKAMNPAQRKKDEEIEELRRTVQELNKGKDNPTGDSK